MFRNFFSIAFRYIRSNKTFAALNILGLSIGISACWITYRMVAYEYSFDQKYPEKERVYQLVSRSISSNNERGMGAITKALLPVLRKDISGIEKIAPVYYTWNSKLSIRNANGQLFEKEDDLKYIATLPDYFEVMGYRWLAGDKRTALNAPEKVVITAKKAKEYFPGLEPSDALGKLLTYNDTVQKQVSGVLADLDFPTSLDVDEFAPVTRADINDDMWGTIISQDLMLIRIAKDVKIENVLQQINAIYTERNKELFIKHEYKAWIDAVPANEMHFSTDYPSEAKTVNKKVLVVLTGVAVFLLILACINYMNITTAQLPGRAKEIGIRKTMGSSTGALIKRFMGETLVITSMAALVSFALSYAGTRLLKDFMPDGISGFMDYGEMALFMIALITIVSLISGIYPAWIASRVRTIGVLKGEAVKSLGRYSLPLRKTLIVFQFFIAQVFIVGAFIIGQQLHYMLNKDLGFNKEAVITMVVPYNIAKQPAFKDKEKVLLQKLTRHPAVIRASLADRPMENAMAGSVVYSTTKAGKIQGQLNLKMADTGYLGVYHFRLLAGRNISPSDTINEYVINEAAVKKFGFGTPDSAIGKFLYNPNTLSAFPVVGVVKDYHQFSFHSEIVPAAIVASERKKFNIRLASGSQYNFQQIISGVEREWESIYPGVPFDYKLYDETIAEIIEPDTRIAKLVNLATGIAIFISCLGLFSLATLMAFQRTKEIGIRKVLGSTVSAVVQLLAKDFVKLVLLSVILATPLAWWLMQEWLRNFAFAVKIEWWMFAITSAIALLIALVTVSFQSVKAAMINPVETLKTE